MRYMDIPKRTRNAIEKRIDSAIGKYSFEEVKSVANKLFEKILKERKLMKEIVEKESELQQLKKKKRK